MTHEEMLAWFGTKGIEPETVGRFGVQVDDEGVIGFPYPSGTIKRRKQSPDGTRDFKPPYGWPRGKPLELFHVNQPTAATTAFIVEGETDAMKLDQELLAALGDNAPDVYGLPGIEAWKEEWAKWFAPYERVYVILDNDVDYNVQARVDTAWRNMRWALNGSKRVHLPEDVKDVCDFFSRYDLDLLRELTKRTPVQTSRYRALDLTKEPPPVRWLVDGFICRADIHLMIGEPGIGKSWLTMALAAAVANKESKFLGHNILEHGRVLYVDEENPEDLVYDRFRKLGVDRETARNIRYLSNAGVRLDGKDADVLVEEALDFEPALVVLDSLTRFHTEDENHAGAMAALFNSAIKPLARETGAAVVLIHHANKTDSNSSYKRSRGSGDITASVDSGFDVRETGENSLVLATFKSRRKAQGEALYMTIQDTSEGRVQIVGGDAPDAPF
jgi:KaiC/GvpD/RAD55 family RecA-like ATPase